MEIQAEARTDHDEGDLLLIVSPVEAADDAGLENNLTFVRDYLSMEDIYYASPKERLNARRAAKNFMVWDGQLFRRTKYGTRVVAGKAVRTKIMRILHDSVGHWDFRTTFNFAQDQAYWPRMVADVYEYVSYCDACQLKQKGSNMDP